MSDSNNTPAGWYPSEGQMRYWDGTRWTEQKAPMDESPGAPAESTAPPGPVGHRPQGPSTPPNRPLWKKKRFLIPALIVLAIIIGAAIGGGGATDDEPAAGDSSSQGSGAMGGDKGKDKGKTGSGEKSGDESADDEPETDDGTTASLTLPKQNGDWRLDQMQLKDDGLGDFGGVGRITYTGDDQDGGDNIFTVTVFSKDGETILATLTGSATSVKPGQTVTTQFISTDPYQAGTFPFTFQNDL